MKHQIAHLLLVLIICSSAYGQNPSEKFKPEERHPGHKMHASYIPKKKVFKIGEPVEVTLVIKNIGETLFSFTRGGRQRGPRDNQFAFTAESGGKMLPDIGNPMNFGGLGAYITLKPKEDIKIPVTLNSWFNFDDEGVVSLRGSYYMAFRDPTVEDYSFIWEDFACGEFTVTIKNSEQGSGGNG